MHPVQLGSSFPFVHGRLLSEYSSRTHQKKNTGLTAVPFLFFSLNLLIIKLRVTNNDSSRSDIGL